MPIRADDRNGRSTAKPGDYGAFAPRVFEAARVGESGALEIVGRAAGAIVAIYANSKRSRAERIAYRRRRRRTLEANISPPRSRRG